LDWIGLDWIGLDWIKWIGQYCGQRDGQYCVIGLDWIGLDWIKWIGLDWIGLDWIGQYCVIGQDCGLRTV